MAKNLIQQDINSNKGSKIKEERELGKKIYDIRVNTTKYKISNAIFMGILLFLLCLTLIRFIVIFKNWLVITISIIASISCVIWMILAIKKSLIKVNYVLYENYLVKSIEDWDDYANHLDFTGYKIKTSVTDKIFKPKTSTIYLFYNDKKLPILKLSCIEEDCEKVMRIILNTINARKKEKENPNE